MGLACIHPLQRYFFTFGGYPRCKNVHVAGKKINLPATGCTLVPSANSVYPSSFSSIVFRYHIKVKILDINADKERISLGIKHLKNDPVQEYIETNPINSKVTGKILEIEEKGLKIELDKDKQILGFIKKSNLSNDKNENKTDRFALNENIDSIIISIDSKSRTLNLSIKELEIRDEKEALSKYGSSASGASLGDILGSVLKK